MSTGEYDHNNTVLGDGAMADAIANLTNIGYDNTAFGNGALKNLQPKENESSAFGSQALYTATSGENSGFGAHAGSQIGTATGNALFGNWAGRFVSGDNNTANGYRALAGDTNNENDVSRPIAKGNNNTATGKSAMRYYPDGNNNTADGFEALKMINGGDNNTASGSGALGAVTTGSDNTAQGYGAGAYVTTGSHNTFLGSGADAGLNPTNAKHRTAVGAGVVVDTDNTVILGTSTDRVGVRVSTTAPDAAFHVVSVEAALPAIHGVSSNGGAAVKADGTAGSVGVQATSDTGVALLTNGGHQYSKIKSFAPYSTTPNTTDIYSATNNDHIIIISKAVASNSTGTVKLPIPSVDGHVFIIRNASPDDQKITVDTFTPYFIDYNDAIPAGGLPTITLPTANKDAHTYVSSSGRYVRIA